MRTVTDTYNVYKYDELSEESKETARDWGKRGVNTYDWWDYCLEWWQEKLEALGFENAKIYFSHMYRQGSGASFEADIDVDKVMSALTYCTDDRKDAERYRCAVRLEEEGLFELTIRQVSSHYEHEYTREVDSEWYGDYDPPKWVQEVETDVENFRVALCQEIMRDLYREYEYLTSDESAVENIKANDYEFYDSGEVY